MTSYSNRQDQLKHFMLSMEELMQYEVHGNPQPIRFRRTSREYSRSYFERWQKPLPFHSFYPKEAEMNAECNMLKRKCPLESGEEHTIASSSSHECLTRPCTCPDPGKSKEMCVIKKVENWLLGRCLNVNEAENMDSEGIPVLPSQSKCPSNVNKRPDLEKFAVSALPASVLLRQISGASFPVYILNVRVVGIEPAPTDILRVVRGHCSHYSCNSTITNIVWTNAGPLTYGKLVRPYCPECCQTRRKRYLNLYFHLELLVEDNLGQMLRIVIARDAAVRFFGCTTYRFLVNPKRRLKIKKLLETLLLASNASRSAPVPGLTFDIRILPVAVDHTEQVQFHMYGDNSPLFELVKKA